MTPKDIKRAKHNFKQKQHQEASRQKHQQMIKDIQAGKFRDQPYRRGIDLIIHQQDLQDPSFIHHYRSLIRSFVNPATLVVGYKNTYIKCS